MYDYPSCVLSVEQETTEKPSGSDSSAYGHSKGVVGWDTSTGFWVIHSFPKYPLEVESGFAPVADGQTLYGQSVLCISTDYTGLNTIGDQLECTYN